MKTTTRRVVLLGVGLLAVATALSGCAAALTYFIADQINRNWDDWFNKNGDDGNPANPEDYHVYLNGYDMGALSGGSGLITLSGVSAGRYLIGVTKPGDKRTGTNVVASVDANGRADLSSSNIIEGGLITGTVRRSDTGAVVPYAQVTAVKDAAATIAAGNGPVRIPPPAGATLSYMMTIANAGGGFTLGPAIYGDWLVTSTLAGLSADVCHVSISSTSNGVANLVMDVDASATAGLVRGSVTHDGSPVSGALLSGKLGTAYQPTISAATRNRVAGDTGLTLPAGPWFEWTTLVVIGGSDGQYLLDLPAGAQTVEALSPGLRASSAAVAVTAGGATTQNYALVAP